MDNSSQKLVPTADGSLTLWQPDLHEHYHNLAGAYTEALENYVKPALHLFFDKMPNQLTLIDACFGLGYNTFVLLQRLARSTNCPASIRVIAIENDFSLATKIPSVLEQPMLFDLRHVKSFFDHNVYYQTQDRGIQFKTQLTSKIEIEFLWQPGTLENTISALAVEADLVFHDAFSPRLVPELWTAELFQHYKCLLATRRGCLLTYSSAGAVRGGLAEAGFQLYRTQAVGQKSGGTLASLQPLNVERCHNIFALSAEEQAFMASRAGVPYRNVLLGSQATKPTSRQDIFSRRLVEQNRSNRPKALR